MVNEERYARQIALGWDQERIQQAAIAILGNNNVDLNLFLTFLGFDHILNVDDRTGNPLLQGHFLDINLEQLVGGENSPDVKTVAALMRRLQPDSQAFGVAHDLSGEYLRQVVRMADVVVETRQHPDARESTLAYAMKSNTPAVFISNLGNAVLVHTFTPEMPLDQREKSFFLCTHGDGFNPLLLYGASAHAAGEVVNHVLKQGKRPTTPFVWNLGGDERTWYAVDHEFAFDPAHFRDLTILQVGVGGTGVNTAYLVSRFIQPRRLYLVEPDDVEESNQNRQVLYYSRTSIGRPKVDVALEVLGKDPRVTTELVGLKQLFDPSFCLDDRIDLIIDTTSGDVARLLIQNFAIAHGIPLLSVGADAYAAQVHRLVPGIHGCLDHQYGVYNNAVYEALLQNRPGCDQVPEGSNIVTTAVGGAFTVGEIPSALRPEIYGRSPRDILYYRLTQPERAYVAEVTGPCGCGPKPLVIPDLKDVRFIETPGMPTTILVRGEVLERS
ncbi:MAG: ThiF family adenylyltransferase [Nanoarchaeota archaeon]